MDERDCKKLNKQIQKSKARTPVNPEGAATKIKIEVSA
jgi:hypothetical protein